LHVQWQCWLVLTRCLVAILVGVFAVLTEVFVSQLSHTTQTVE
jgi:hypothetical protein